MKKLTLLEKVLNRDEDFESTHMPSEDEFAELWAVFKGDTPLTRPEFQLLCLFDGTRNIFETFPIIKKTNTRLTLLNYIPNDTSRDWSAVDCENKDVIVEYDIINHDGYISHFYLFRALRETIHREHDKGFDTECIKLDWLTKMHLRFLELVESTRIEHKDEYVYLVKDFFKASLQHLSFLTALEVGTEENKIQARNNLRKFEENVDAEHLMQQTEKSLAVLNGGG